MFSLNLLATVFNLPTFPPFPLATNRYRYNIAADKKFVSFPLTSFQPASTPWYNINRIVQRIAASQPFSALTPLF